MLVSSCYFLSLIFSFFFTTFLDVYLLFYLSFYILFRFFVKGKTTSAASWGVLLSDSGLKTLVISTDPAHSLGDAFQEKLNGVPRKLDTGSSGGNFIFLFIFVVQYHHFFVFCFYNFFF